MSDIAKWGILAAGAVLLIGLIFALPFVDFIDLSAFSNAINTLVVNLSPFFKTARGLVNYFLSPFGRTVLTGIMGWLVGKSFLMTTIKITSWAYHFIFRG